MKALVRNEIDLRVYHLFGHNIDCPKCLREDLDFWIHEVIEIFIGGWLEENGYENKNITYLYPRKDFEITNKVSHLLTALSWYEWYLLKGKLVKDTPFGFDITLSKQDLREYYLKNERYMSFALIFDKRDFLMESVTKDMIREELLDV